MPGGRMKGEDEGQQKNAKVNEDEGGEENFKGR